MDPKLLIFLLGAAGALAPEVIRLWTIARAGDRMTWSWSYIVVSILFAGLGGLVAFILPAENMNAAFYAGVATPVLVNTAIKKAEGEERRVRTTKTSAGDQRLSRFDYFIEGL